MNDPSLTDGRAQVTPLHPGAGETLTEAAYRSLRNDLVRGRHAPGERLRIERLRRLYDVGPTPLREALQRLSAEGLVRADGNRGFTASPLDLADFDDLNSARSAVEREALRLAIARGDELWEAQVVSAAYLIGKADRAIASERTVQPEGVAQPDGTADGLLDHWEAANAAFHRATVAACGSNWLLRIREGLHTQCERYRRASIYRRRGKRDLAAEHQEIAAAVLERDADLACTLVTAHFAATAGDLALELGKAQ